MDWQSKLKAVGACSEAIEWAKDQPTFKAAWDSCERGDWLLWLAAKMEGKQGWPTRQQIVLAACDCASLSLKYVTKGEDRPRNAIEVARAWANGNATIEEVRTASAASASALDASAASAAYAASAAAAAAYDAYDDAAASAASAAALDASAASASAASAISKTLKRCAVIVRKRISVPEVL